ncbi:hypothetical protein SS50377_26981 [Spironucleus salmonicida]|uniref:Trm112p-like protein n=1 Tax=Spironucleus salmonicida TaxID=348837 RepID=V6LS55_9EUKA|nr:hypothetical protein SS50377_26981 [Spironucleus salmonicida]|eukprot:EST47492.1 hypothetical protein SS50377_12478 [Spironucleus salmonicida]
MRLTCLLLVACPNCQGELKASVESFEVNDINDEFAQIKVKKIIEKFGETIIRNMITDLQWDQPQTQQEWIQILLQKSILDGTLKCVKCDKTYKIIKRLPIFVDE